MATPKDLGNGKYRIIISNGYKNGTRNRISKNFEAPNLREAIKIAKILEADVLSGKDKPEKKANSADENKEHTFLELVEMWKSLIEDDDYVHKTLFRYDGILEQFLIPYFGKMNIKDVTYPVVKKYLTTLDVDCVRRDGKPGGYSTATKAHHRRLIIMLLNQAVAYEWISDIPYKESVSEKRKNRKKKKTANKKKIVFYTEAEVQELYKVLDSELVYNSIGDEKTILDKAESLKHKVICRIGFETGFRLSELCGLEFSDINYSDKSIGVYRTSHYTSEKGIYTQDVTKNGDPERAVSVSDDLLKLIKEYEIMYYMMWEEKERQKVARTNRINYDIKISKRLFTKYDGTPVNPSTLTKWFPAYLKSKGLKGLTVHGMRHTHASILIFKRVDILTISKRLGHKTVSITLDTYGHLMPKADRACADIFSNLLE